MKYHGQTKEGKGLELGPVLRVRNKKVTRCISDHVIFSSLMHDTEKLRCFDKAFLFHDYDIT